jgi:hypothetical protein
VTTKPAQQKILKRILHTEEDKYNHENIRSNKSHKMSRYANEE